ncbi:MAG: hypothetical protein ABI609_13835 [Acidobacteriota bacterium]
MISKPDSTDSRRPGAIQRLWFVGSGLDSNVLLYLVLLLLVWGLTVPLCGLWQDDTLLLRLARSSEDHGVWGWFNGFGFPLRRLYTLPFHLALATPQPIWTLHLIFGVAWLGQALAAGWIAGLLLPGQWLTRFLAVCLTLTATSDYLTDNLTALGYNIAALALLLAVGGALRYLECRRVRWVVLSCAALAFSIWTLDIAIPSLPFAPLLMVWMVWRGRSKAWRPILVVMLAWGLSLAPAVPIEWRFLHDPAGYVAGAMRHVSLAERIQGTAWQWLENFRPWRWAFARRVWYPRPAAAIPPWVMALGATVSAAWFALRARRLRDTEGTSDTVRALSLASLFASMALATNAAYAFLTMSELHYRTHILARTWASLAIAVAVGWAIRRWPRLRPAFLLVPAAFIGLGVWGGLERQDLWVSTWRMHQRELSSIVAGAPALVPGTGIILRSPPLPGRYLATEADYLAQCWMILLYDDPGIHALRATAERGTGCRATADALECWHEHQAVCVAAGTCPADRFPYERLVLMDFDDREGTYHVVPTLDGDQFLAGTGVNATRYRPEERILRQPFSPRQRALLLE